MKEIENNQIKSKKLKIIKSNKKNENFIKQIKELKIIKSNIRN